ncbi:hypothetical protein B0A79_02155, partial [Flavobacterium piscis]
VNGKSAFEIWKEIPGNETKTEADYAAAIKGEPGENGVASFVPTVITGHNIATYTDASGQPAALKETVTSLTYDSAAKSLVYGDENGTMNSLSLTELVGNAETITTLVHNPTAKTLTFNGEGQTTSTINLKDITTTTPSTVLEVTGGKGATFAPATVNIVPATVEGQVLTTTGTGTDAKVEWKAPVASNVMGIKVISSDYIVTAADYTVIASHLNSDIKITLPDAASNVGRVLVINQIDIESDSGAKVAVKFNTEVIYSDTVSKNQIISDYYSTSTGGSLKVTLQSDGANWYVISFM